MHGAFVLHCRVDLHAIDATDVEARLEAVNAWLGRHDAAAAAFLERVNGKAIVLGEDVIAVSDDVACGTMGCGL